MDHEINVHLLNLILYKETKLFKQKKSKKKLLFIQFPSCSYKSFA